MNGLKEYSNTYVFDEEKYQKDQKESKKNVGFESFFEIPVMSVQLDCDLEKLTELVFQIQNNDKKGVQTTNIGGWQSENIIKEEHEEFIKLKKEISQHLQTYHLEVFRGMVFKENITLNLTNMWVNINEKHHYNEWHIHAYATLSGTYYIKHDGSKENGELVFKHPNSTIEYFYWREGIIENHNEVTAGGMKSIPKSNMLIIFPSWLEHKVGLNLKDDPRISLSFNSLLLPEIK